MDTEIFISNPESVKGSSMAINFRKPPENKDKMVVHKHTRSIS
jgi:hypothetical protein